MRHSFLNIYSAKNIHINHWNRWNEIKMSLFHKIFNIWSRKAIEKISYSNVTLWTSQKKEKEKKNEYTPILCYILLKSRSEIDWACSRMFTVWILAIGNSYLAVEQHMVLSANKLKKSNFPPKNRHKKTQIHTHTATQNNGCALHSISM